MEKIKNQVEEEIKAENKNLEQAKKEAINLLKKIEIDWDWMADLDSAIMNIHNSLIWILSKKETLENLYRKKLNGK